MPITLEVPTLDEVEIILDKRHALSKHHRHLYRILNDFRGVYEDERDMLLKHFSRWAKNHCKLSHLESSMYLHFIIFEADYNNKAWKPIVKFLKRHSYIASEYSSNDNLTYAFGTEQEALRWILSYRWVKSQYLDKLKEIEWKEIQTE